MSFMNNVFNPNKHSLYEPLYPEKYIGKQIICRSKWEFDFCNWCDNNSGILQWSSEPFAIPYFDVVRRKKRRYYPDFLIKVKGKDGKLNTYIIEIKPYKEVALPKRRGTNKTKMYETITYATNVSKWKAADNWCKKKGWIFKIITEKELYRK